MAVPQRVSINLYRACLREVKQFKRLFPKQRKDATAAVGANTNLLSTNDDKIYVTDPLKRQFYGIGGFSYAENDVVERLQRWSGFREDFRLKEVKNWASSLQAVKNKTPVITTKELRDLIRLEFEKADTSDISNLQRGIAAISVIREFMENSECTTISENANNGIQVEITSKFLMERANFNGQPPIPNFYMYRIRVSSENKIPAVLTGRAWKFFQIEDNSKSKLVQEVEKFSPGVVGLHPPISTEHPYFEYISGAELRSNEGTMEGAFQFKNEETGDVFEVELVSTPLKKFE